MITIFSNRTFSSRRVRREPMPPAWAPSDWILTPAKPQSACTSCSPATATFLSSTSNSVSECTARSANPQASSTVSLYRHGTRRRLAHLGHGTQSPSVTRHGCRWSSTSRVKTSARGTARQWKPKKSMIEVAFSGAQRRLIFESEGPHRRPRYR